MLATLRQQFAPGLLAQGLQHIQLLIELLGAATGASLGDFPQPLAAMAVIFSPSSSTRCPPASADLFQPPPQPPTHLSHNHIPPPHPPQHAPPRSSPAHPLHHP